MNFSKFITYFAILFELFMKKYQVKNSEFFQSSATVICVTANNEGEAMNLMNSQTTFPVFDKSTMRGFTHKEGEWSLNTQLFKEGTMLHSINEKDLFFINVDRELLTLTYTA